MTGDSPAGETLTLTLDLDLHDVDAVAVLLPTYTSLAAVNYRAEPEP